MLLRRLSRPQIFLLLLAAVAALVLARLLLAAYWSPGSLLPHGYCFTWNPALLWTHVVSDSLIGIAYLSIPLTLLHLVRRRTDLPFNWIVVLFAIFIVSCGATHWIEVWTIWNPDYWFSGLVKAITASASMLTAAALVFLVPGILAIPTVSQLTAAKDALELEVRQRRAAQDELLNERAELERRVLERTEALQQAVTQAHHAKQLAEEANLQKDRFLAKVSHELRTPLQSTLSWSQVMQRSNFDPERTARAVDRIVHNVRLQARLIDDLLDVSRILSGKLRLDFQEVNLLEIMERAVGVVHGIAQDKGVTLETVFDIDPALRVSADPARLEQVVWNLLSNAVQASSAEGRVQLSVQTTDHMVRVAVEDWGVGIDAADLDHIFEPFHQGARRQGQHHGLGLGLAIVHHIVTLSGGEVTAQSKGLGGGAKFVVQLPRLPHPGEESTPAVASLTAPQRDGLAALRIVYVEDEPDIAESCEWMLQSLGLQVSTCQRFEQAEQRVREGGFDILLTDLNLDGGHTGLELLHILRQTPHGQHMPALIFSAYGSESDLLASRAAGFNQHLIKPLDAQHVALALLAALDKPPGSVQ